MFIARENCEVFGGGVPRGTLVGQAGVPWAMVRRLERMNTAVRYMMKV